MSGFHPVTEPLEGGLLEVGDGQRIYWEVSGTPAGQPALILHGGPGSGSSPSTRCHFDPQRYRIVSFDQRGCGRSPPHASGEGVDFSVNTTAHLIGDIERLRVHLGVERWLIYGASWGSTLGLAYAEAHPARVRAMVLAGVTTTRRSEIDWLYRGMAPLLPAQWERFRAGVPAGTKDRDLVAAYGDLLFDPDPAVRAKAARDFHDWDTAAVSTDPNVARPARWSDPAYVLARARIVTAIPISWRSVVAVSADGHRPRIGRRPGSHPDLASLMSRPRRRVRASSGGGRGQRRSARISW